MCVVRVGVWFKLLSVTRVAVVEQVCGLLVDGNSMYAELNTNFGIRKVQQYSVSRKMKTCSKGVRIASILKFASPRSFSCLIANRTFFLFRVRERYWLW